MNNETPRYSIEDVVKHLMKEHEGMTKEEAMSHTLIANWAMSCNGDITIYYDKNEDGYTFVNRGALPMVEAGEIGDIGEPISPERYYYDVALELIMTEILNDNFFVLQNEETNELEFAPRWVMTDDDFFIRAQDKQVAMIYATSLIDASVVI